MISLLPKTIPVYLEESDTPNLYNVFHLLPDLSPGGFITEASKEQILEKVSGFLWTVPRTQLLDWEWEITYKYLADYFNLSTKFIFDSLPSIVLDKLDYEEDEIEEELYPSHLNMLWAILYTWCHIDESNRDYFWHKLDIDPNFKKVWSSCFHPAGKFPELDEQPLYRCLTFPVTGSALAKRDVEKFLEGKLSAKDSFCRSASSEIEPCLNPALIPEHFDSPYVLQCLFRVTGDSYFPRISAIYNRNESETIVQNCKLEELVKFQVIENPHLGKSSPKANFHPIGEIKLFTP